MGLKSLPMLNKSGISIYWQNIWNTQLRYSRYFIFSIHLYYFFSYLLNSRKYFLLNKNIYNLNEKKILSKKKKNRFFYLGRVWLMKYQNWSIIFLRVLTQMTHLWGYKINSYSKINFLYHSFFKKKLVIFNKLNFKY